MTSSTMKTLTLLGLLTTAAACDTSSQADPCAGSTAATPYSLSLSAHLERVVATNDAEVVVQAESLSCVDYVVTQPDSDWALHGVAPAEVDLAPNLYSVQFSHVDDDGVPYTSELIEIDLEGGETIEAGLCADLSGNWSCQGDGEVFDVRAEMQGCAVAFDHLDLKDTLVEGQCLLDEDGKGVLGVRSERGLDLVLPSLTEPGTDEAVSCWLD